MNLDKPDHTMKTKVLVQMLVAAEVSMDLWYAEAAAANARYEYLDDIRHYEEQHGSVKGRISAEAPEHAAIRQFTAEKYKAYQVLKRKVYSAKCRLCKACVKLALMQGFRHRGHSFLDL